MDTLKLMETLSIRNEKKIVLVVIDGLGGAPHNLTNKTELETAKTPNLDNLSRNSLCGLSIPVDWGITPGSGPGHLALFGYDPIKYLIGRGVLEVLGLGMQMQKGDVAFRGNFASINNEGIVTDRRAGRIPTEKTVELINELSKRIKTIGNTQVLLKAGKGHRFAGIFRGENLCEFITENDPHKEGNKPHKIKPIEENNSKAVNTAQVVDKFISEVQKVIGHEKLANYVLLRGFSEFPNIPTMEMIYKLSPAAICVYPMYKGLAQLVGMKIIDGCENIEDEIKVLKKIYKEDFDFFYLHMKDTDALGEDGNFEMKVKKLEEIDNLISDIINLKPDVLIITGDHSSPAVMKGHSWHPVPIIISSNLVAVSKNNIDKFCEKELFMKGGLGVINATKVMPLAMAYAGKLDKYGA